MDNFFVKRAAALVDSGITAGVLFVLALGGAAALAIGAFLASWTWPALGLFVFSLPVVLMLGFNEYRRVREFIRQRAVVSDVPTHVDRWLKRYGFSVGEIKEGVYKDAVFAFSAERVVRSSKAGVERRQRVEVRQMDKKEPYFEIAGGWELSLTDEREQHLLPHQLQGVNNMISSELAIEFARMRLAFHREGGKFTATERILIDETLDEQKFTEGLKSILSAGILAQHTFNKHSVVALMLKPPTDASGLDKAAPPL